MILVKLCENQQNIGKSRSFFVPVISNNAQRNEPLRLLI